MTPDTAHHRTIVHRLKVVARTCLALMLAACSTTPLPPPPPVEQPTPPPTPVAPPAHATPPITKSFAISAREYRKDAASHLYRLNVHRIYSGKMPPLMYAIGVLQVDIDRRGEVIKLGWMRAPTHAPEVVAEIERTVRQAAPYPIPTRLGRVTYTDTWLWDKSGRFQLDTLTEGQR